MSDEYEIFSKRMHDRFPKMFAGKYGGFAINKGWWPLLESLCETIQSHIDWKTTTRENLLKANPYNHTIPDKVEQVVVLQVKEKFGSLRFYYQGGDDYVQGAVTLAENLTNHLCEECGGIGKRRSGGWIRTLCDKHEQQRNNEIEEQARRDGLEL
jgi:hypothetical protein